MQEYSDFHEYLYGDPRRVRRARTQAEGRIAVRYLRAVLVESWAIPICDWLDRKLFDTPEKVDTSTKT